MINIHTWKMRDPSKNTLAQVLTCEPYISGGRATHVALNGAVYLQTIGSGAQRLKMTILCESLADKYDIDQKNNDGFMFNITYRGVTYYGYIEVPLVSWSPVVPGSVYTGSFVFIVDNFVEAVEI